MDTYSPEDAGITYDENQRKLAADWARPTVEPGEGVVS